MMTKTDLVDDFDDILAGRRLSREGGSGLTPGPRASAGLASLVFALIALEELGSGADDAVAVIGLSVFLSVLAHGLTAAPLATRYEHAATANRPEPGEPEPDLPVRGLPRRLDTAAHHTTHAKSNYAPSGTSPGRSGPSGSSADGPR
jgi:hypothetical protein